MAAIREDRASGGRAAGAPNLIESDDLAAVGQTAWMPLVGSGEHVFTCDVDAVATPAGTWVIEAQRVRQDGSFSTIQTLFTSSAPTDFPQVGRLSGWWQVRVRCSAYVSGTYRMSIAQ